MEQSITLAELATLLAIFWLPVFALAVWMQWRVLVPGRGRAAWRSIAFPLEFVVAFAAWRSPLSSSFPSLDLLGALSIGGIPLCAAILSAASVTTVVWMIARRGRRAVASRESRDERAHG